MPPKTVAEARTAFRERHASKYYSGQLHLASTVGLCLLVAVVCAASLEAVRPLEWLTLPATFLYANLSEYLGHRGPMHHRTRLLGAVFRRHTLEHHAFFTREASSFESPLDYKAVLFPPILLVFFIGCFALPVGALLYLSVSPNVCFLFVLTAVLYFLNYELLHFAYHADTRAPIGRLPFIDRLRRRHIAHHDKRLMSSYNFNITYPLCDWLFDTSYPQEGGPG